jgi:hypothetical protein
MKPDLSLDEYVRANPRELIAVRFPRTGDLAFSELAANLHALVLRGLVRPNWNRRGGLKSVHVLIPVKAARAIIQRTTPEAGRAVFIRARRRSKAWPPRFERAKSCGEFRRAIGASVTLWVGPDLQVGQ